MFSAACQNLVVPIEAPSFFKISEVAEVKPYSERMGNTLETDIMVLQIIQKTTKKFLNLSLNFYNNARLSWVFFMIEK